jgi:hypothetical protein
MSDDFNSNSTTWLNKVDFSAIADPDDKLAECEYFLSLAEKEQDRSKFRWLSSAFLNATYSFFETSALWAYVAFTAPDTGEPVENVEATEILKKYVSVSQRSSDPYYVTTIGRHEITQQLYKFRKATTHHYALSIMEAGPSLPEDFHFGSERENGTPALELCRKAMSLIRKVHTELHEV